MRKVLLALAMLGVCGAGHAAGDRWDTYGNARYGFFVCYPAALLTPRGESDNGDGNTFKTRDGRVTVLAYGAYPMNGDGGAKALADLFHLSVKGAEEKGYKINYTLLKPALYAYSGVKGAGTKDARVVYEKTFEKDQRDISLYAEYPAEMKATMDPVIAKMAGCLVAGKIEYERGPG